jgi:sterol desaturase/sphingolipid hydroxylase (fatty acid hydroxylase superfamily)
MIVEAFVVGVVLARPVLGPWWASLCDHYSEFDMFVYGVLISVILGHFLGSAPYVLLDVLRPPLARQRKIQAEKYPSRRDVLRACLSHFLSSVLVMLPMLLVGSPCLQRVGIFRDRELPSNSALLVQLAYFLVVEDYLNYWLHRMLHLPWLYNNIHSLHHEFTSPFALMSAHAHPLETVILAIPTFAGPALTGCHMFTLFVWQVVRLYEAIDIHSGYELPWSLKAVFPSYAGADHHDFHHYMHSGNFASIFVWCDRLYGTSVGYEHFKVKRQRAGARGAPSPSPSSAPSRKCVD